jgi:uncharacterized protein YcfL
MKHLRHLAVALTALILAGCSTHQSIAAGFGQAYQHTFATQSDLTRTSVENSAFLLSGREAAAIRINVQESSSNTETAKSQTSF